MPPSDAESLEDLLADALAAFDDGGDAALRTFLAAHELHRAALERGIARCREMGLLGASGPVRDFPERLGEFHLLRRLGSGGMGVVYEAEQQSLGRRVALKVVRPELLFFEGARERFRREIEAVARLAHPAIVPVLASGEQDGLPWYAMELISGSTAHEICETLQGRDPATLRGSDLRTALGGAPETGTDPLDGTWWQVCVRIAHTIAGGVRHAHLRGIVHRDIKPSNLMLRPDGRAVLLDFGVAMVAGSREFTRTGNTPGSPAFMSPEQLRGDAVDERTDVYSLAATLWQMLTLRAPFAGASDLQRIRDGELPSLRHQNRDVPPELELVVRTAMDRDRERRYHDMDAFAADLLAVLQRRPIAARRLGLPLRVVRWAQRHRVTATALVATLLVGTLLPAVFAWRERAVNRELQEGLTATLEAIHTMLVRVGDEKFRYVPEGDAVARAALEDAIAMYRRLLAHHPDDQRLVGNAADAFARYAMQLARSADGRDRARAILREEIELLGSDRDDVEPGRLVKRSLARIHLGDLATQDRDLASAAEHFARAEHELDIVVRIGGFRIDAMRQQVELAIKRLAMLDPVRDADRMLAVGRDAAAIARRLCEEKDNPSDTCQLVALLRTHASILHRAKRAQDALPLLDEALQLARSMPADAVVWPPQPQIVAAVLQTLGYAYLQLRDQHAIAALKECLALREAAVRDHPSDVMMRSELGAALHALADLNVAQDQDERAVERLDRAIALQRTVVAEMPAFAQGHDYLRNHLTIRGTALAHLGRAKDLLANIDELAAMQDDSSALRTAARHLLRLAKLREAADAAADPSLPSPIACLDRAMALLVQAETIGWGPNNPLAESIYDPLRDRAEFRSLAERVAARLAQAGDASPSTSNASREMPR